VLEVIASNLSGVLTKKSCFSLFCFLFFVFYLFALFVWFQMKTVGRPLSWILMVGSSSLLLGEELPSEKRERLCF